MKTFLSNLLLLSALAGVAPSALSGEVDYEFEACVPRVLSLSSPGGSGVPPISMSFYYDAKGKLLIPPGATAGADSITGSATLGKLVKGARTFTVTAKGVSLKTLSLVLKGQVGQGYATCTYQGPSGRVTVSELPVTLSLLSPVVTSFTLSSQIDSRGRLTGSGKIESGFQNDSTSPAVLTGTSNKTLLKWQLKQGSQRLSFTGKQVSGGFVGTLVASVPPANGSYKNFLFPGFDGQRNDGTTTFRGGISQAGAGEFPSPAAGATITVSSDLNLNGAIESIERFSAQVDDDGKYNLTCSVADGGRALVEINQEGFAAQLKVLDPIRAGVELVNNFTLRPLLEMTVADATATAQDGKLDLLDLPSEVTSVRARVFNPVTEADHFPGEFADDQGSLLVSSVFTAIEARDDAGREVTDLGAGAMLRMQVPKDTWATLRDLRAGTGQIDCPLYYYNEASGEWKRSSADGWLEDSQGAKIVESRLAEIRDGLYTGNVFVAGPITHLSYWNLDWPVETHACITGTVVDASGNPLAGAWVTIRGATYTGSTSPQVTGADGRFCADVMRSESPGEDVDGNSTAGETHQVNIGISHQGQLYSFGSYNTPRSQSTCEAGGCLDVGRLALSQANSLKVELCTITGTVRHTDDGTPVSNTMVFAFDELVEAEVFYQFFTNPAVSFFATTDQTGAFSLTVPTIGGLSVVASYSRSLGNNTYEAGHGMAQTGRCTGAPVLLELDRYRNSAILDSTGTHVGSFFQHGSEISGYVYLNVGNEIYWAVPPDDEPFRLPSQPGASVNWALYTLDGTGSEVVIGQITFTATTAIGGTWQSTGIALAGTWGN